MIEKNVEIRFVARDTALSEVADAGAGANWWTGDTSVEFAFGSTEGEAAAP